MTRRERLEAKIDKRCEWAKGREQKAESLRRATPDSLRHDWAFITQPGRIPERERMNRRDEKAFEHQNMAGHHRSKAAGLQGQLNNTIFSDDTDAIEQLESKISLLEAECTRNTAVNRTIRKKPKNVSTPEKVTAIVELTGWAESIVVKWFEPDCCGRIGIPGYVNSNMRGRISAAKKRLVCIKRQQDRQAKAAAAGGVSIEGGTYVSITFTEKPDRSVLDALRAAGFRWGQGCWGGYREKMPEEVRELL